MNNATQKLASRKPDTLLNLDLTTALQVNYSMNLLNW